MALQEDHNQVETSLVSNGPPKQKQGRAHTEHATDLFWWKIFIKVTIFLLIIILILIIVIVIVTVTQKTTEPSVSPGKIHACTSGWKAYEQKCYFFSEEEKNWTLSQSFCASQNASLAVFESEEEMHVVMCLKGNFPFWIGVSREPGQLWKWLHGNSSVLEVSGDGGNCAYLNDEPKPSSSRCSSEHHFICTQSME